MAGKNILIVDDDNKAVRTMIGVLETKGYAVFASDSKGAAVELSQKIRPSLVFINAILSDASGLEVTRALRTLDFMKDVPIIMLTEIEEEFSDRYKSTYGIVSFLKKPIDAKDLLRKTALYVLLETRAGEDSPGAEAEEVVPPAGGVLEEHEVREDADVSVSSLEEESGQQGDYGEIDLSSLTEDEPREEEGEGGEEPEEMALMTDYPERDHTIEAAYRKLRAEKEPEEAYGAPDDLEPSDVAGDSGQEVPGRDADEESGTEGPEPEETRLVSSPVEPPLEPPSRVSALSINRNVMIGVPVAVIALLVIVWYLSSTGGRQEPSAPPKEAETVAVQEEGKTEPLPQGQGTTGSAEAPVVALPQLPGAQEPVQEGTGVAQKEPTAETPSGRTESTAAKPREASVLKPGYYVQVGVFGVRSNAEKLYDALKRKKYSVSIKRDSIRGSTMYRVLIGRYGTRASAVKAMKRITSEEKINATLHRVS